MSPRMLYINGTEPPTAAPVMPRRSTSCQGRLMKDIVSPVGTWAMSETANKSHLRLRRSASHPTRRADGAPWEFKISMSVQTVTDYHCLLRLT
eukprot:scaffold415676_cov34-Prasinocladus_malaysianus.AAC.1